MSKAQHEINGVAMKPRRNAKLLLVDDEKNILHSLQRALRPEPWDVTTANSGESALAVMAVEKFDLVISDARMPCMDGLTLLSEIRRRYPWCIRILLTGYVDIDSTIKAINEGQVYRYIHKPWDDNELRLIIRQALAFQHSERRRLALEKLTRKQNSQLQQLNAGLQDTVSERTAELRQVVDMLDLAYKQLRHGYVTATEVFSSLISRRLPINRQPNSKVIVLVKAYADFIALDEDQRQNLVMAAALYNLGKLSWNDELLEAPTDVLSKSQKLEYLNYPIVGEQLLMALEPLKETAYIIRHHQERWVGSGSPDRLKGYEIPLESRILKLAVDFVEYQMGLILERKVTRENAIKLLKRHRELRYDPNLTDSFIKMLLELAPDAEQLDPSILVLCIANLRPGMVLARNLYTVSGVLLLTKGMELTPRLIKKLAAFESSAPSDQRYTFYVRKPEKGPDNPGDQTPAGWLITS
jgi:response regulator RpfG family c-di-GMP phosphodiesterase